MVVMHSTRAKDADTIGGGASYGHFCHRPSIIQSRCLRPAAEAGLAHGGAGKGRRAWWMEYAHGGLGMKRDPAKPGEAPE
ncbi:hypothetical protein TRAPUB_2385 [Trametes pubescens]|uniref:Uncharacterized protein n=1 Tax=Trametes pubescens TaxID=154538 RepID=A0A1M2VGU1_TRAPU|nr:hypothetical protein TRAPUB_2385 [Trametes pubescens]